MANLIPAMAAKLFAAGTAATAAGTTTAAAVGATNLSASYVAAQTIAASQALNTAPLIASLQTKIAGGTFLGLGANQLKRAGIIAGTLGQVGSSIYQATILRRQAEIEEENNARIREAGRVEARDRDEENLFAMAAEEAKQAASGLNTGSTTFLRRRTRNEILSNRDRRRIVEDADLQGDSALNRAATARGRSKLNGLNSLFSVAQGGLGIANTFIGQGLLTADKNVRATNRQARSIF